MEGEHLAERNKKLKEGKIMNGKMKTMLVAAVVCVGTCAFAGHHGHHGRHYHNDGLALANGIVDLVCRVIAPTPVVVTPAPAVVAPVPVVAPAPVVVAPAPVYYTRPVPPPPPRHYHRPAPAPRGHRGGRGHRR